MTGPVDPVAGLVAAVEALRGGYEHNQLALYVGHDVPEGTNELIGYEAASQLPIEELRARFLADDWGPMWELHNGEDNENHHHDEGAMEALGQVLELLKGLA